MAGEHFDLFIKGNFEFSLIERPTSILICAMGMHSITNLIITIHSLKFKDNL